MIDTTLPRTPSKLELSRAKSSLGPTRSLLQEQEKGIVSDLFVGSLRCVFRYKNAEGEDRSHEVRENFNEILINALKTKNLYENWENFYTSMIEGYRTPEVSLSL